MAMNERKTETVSEALELDMVGDRYPYSDGMSPAACAVKRLFDVVASLTGLIVVSPVMLVVSWLIKREDGGPVIFRQERIGYHGKPFMLYKFRSMSVTAEADGKPELCHKDDRRLTRVGRFLREHHLDEIPQLWNVLKGEMSFVGPRPERAFFVEKIRKIIHTAAGISLLGGVLLTVLGLLLSRQLLVWMNTPAESVRVEESTCRVSPGCMAVTRASATGWRSTLYTRPSSRVCASRRQQKKVAQARIRRMVLMGMYRFKGYV